MPSVVLMAGLLTLSGCTNKDFDLNDVDLTMGFGGESIEIPSSSTANIPLKDVLDISADGSVKIDDDGNYVFQLAGGDVEAAKPHISPIVLNVRDVFEGDIALTASTVNAKSKSRKALSNSINVTSSKEKMFEYHGNDKAVKSLQEADIDEATIVVRINFSSIATAIPTIKSATLTLPGYLEISQVNGNGNGTPTLNGSKVTISNISTARELELSLKASKLDFAQQDSYGNITINNGAIDLDGYFSLNVQADVTAPVANASVKVKIGVLNNTITMRSATGIFDPDINLNTLGEVDVNGIPDFLSDGDVVADLDNPQVILTVSNDMDVSAKVTATIVSYKNGQEMKRIHLPQMSVGKNGVSKICVCRKKTDELNTTYGENNVYAVSDLSTLIYTIPDHISIIDVNAHADQVPATIRFGQEYHVKPAYEVYAPLAFGHNANIVYEDSFDGWNDDIKDLDLAENTYIEVTADATSMVPAYLTITAYPVDANGNKLDDKLLIETPDKVKASTDGKTAVTTPITMKISAKEKNALKQLDGVVFLLEGSATAEGENSITGITLNANKHTLKLDNIKVKLVGKIIGDFN